MRVDEFDFELPEERIALRPANPRDSARLLVVHPAADRCGADGDLSGGASALREVSCEDRQVSDLPVLLRAGDVLVLNDTKVIAAELTGERLRPPRLEIAATLLERLDEATWSALARPGRRLRPGDRLRFGHDGRVCLLGTLEAEVAEKLADGRVILAFNLHGAYLDEALATVGDAPLPPYIRSRRPADERDRADYQTVYAAHEGAVAAPTAGLHFTPRLLDRLVAAGIETAFLTLHVGAGTFLPVRAEDTAEHQMQAERGELDVATADRLNRARRAGGRIVAVGTTSLRLLESAADETGTIHPFAGSTDIFITPGYRFRAVDLLITNFHLPRSTLFMLVAAFSGLSTMKAAYRHAIAHGYRFYSYGDACLLYPERRR
jgi:S-adenosylmethionine:tRNA ribosyltransferase-isomerase